MTISALFRDYAFLTSAYVLEPVDVHFRKTGVYTTGRDILPRELAIPMKKLADARTKSLHYLTYLNQATHKLAFFSRPFPLHGIRQCLRFAELGPQSRERAY